MKVFHLTDFDSCFVWRVGIMRHTLFLTLSFVSLSVLATSVLNVSEQYGAFALVSKGKAATIYVSDQELTTVRKVTELFADDVERVSGFRPQMAADATTASVVVATVGHSGYIDQLVSKHQLDLSSIQGGWEQYMIKVIGRQLVIV